METFLNFPWVPDFSGMTKEVFQNAIQILRIKLPEVGTLKECFIKKKHTIALCWTVCGNQSPVVATRDQTVNSW